MSQPNILNTIAERTRLRIDEEKNRMPLTELRAQAESRSAQTGFPFTKAIAKPEISFICEAKKVSPSKGIIAEDFPYVSIAKEYEKAGAAAISCLTEPYWFLGKDAYLAEIVKEVSIPVLRKDFTIDEYMIYQAKALGASAILLICSILDDCQLNSYLTLAKELGLSVLTETHDEWEIERALHAGADLLGVNNRNLKTFQVDFENTIRLRSLVPKNVRFISESGVKTPEDVTRLNQIGVDGVLIGETLMRAADKKRMLDTLRSKL